MAPVKRRGVSELPVWDILRTFQQTPAAYPNPNHQQFMVWKSFHLGVKGDVWGMLQGYVGFPLEIRNCFMECNYTRPSAADFESQKTKATLQVPRFNDAWWLFFFHVYPLFVSIWLYGKCFNLILIYSFCFLCFQKNSSIQQVTNPMDPSTS